MFDEQCKAKPSSLRRCSASDAVGSLTMRRSAQGVKAEAQAAPALLVPTAATSK